LLQVARTPVPEHRRRPGQIPQTRGVTLERTPRHTAILGLAVGEAFAGLVTARASEAAVDRKARVVEKRLAQQALCLRERIVGWKWHARGAAERRLERGEVIRWRDRPRLHRRRMNGYRRRRADESARHERQGGEPHAGPP